MTDETKLEILNYVVNNIEPTNPNYDEIFLEHIQSNNEVWHDIEVSIFPEGWKSYGYNFEGMVAGNELTTNLTVLYGGCWYDDKNNVEHRLGIIILVDENFNPIKIIDEFSSGTKLHYIQYMKQDDDGTFYYIDDTGAPYRLSDETTTKRFVLVNNFTLINQMTGEYNVILRKSYNLTGNYNNFYCKNMYKDPNSSHYIFFGQASTGAHFSGWTNLKIFSLKIIVGSTNEWTMYYDTASTIFGSAIALFEGENVKFRCLCNYNNVSNRTIDCVSKTYTGNVSRSSIATFSYRPYIDTQQMKKQSVFLTYDNVYFVQNNQHWGVSGSPDAKHIGLYEYNFTNSQLQTIYEKSLGNYDFCNIENIYIDKCDTDLYLEYVNNINYVQEQNYYAGDYHFQRLVNDEWKPIKIAEQKAFFFNGQIIYIKSNFNLLQIFSYKDFQSYSIDYNFMLKEDYNSLNYNGTSYIGYDTLVSKKGQIYSNNKLVFARNLYNKNVYQNTCVSTIQVPNNYLNGIQLDLKKLISNTNFDICNENNITDKNIYEMMFVNYINTITCIDEDTNTIYGNTANYINENINTGTKANYDNTKMNKVRINFTTPQIQLINWTWNVDHYETSFTIYTDEIPTSIEFISNDETTTYITKELEFEQNKYYTISQKLRIE